MTKAELLAVLNGVSDYFENYADYIDGDYGESVMNEECRYYNALQEVIKDLEEKLA